MEKGNIVETLKEAVKYLKDEKDSYEDADGNVYTLEQAKKEKVFVRPVDGKSKAQELLMDIGLDIYQSSVRSLLTELVSLIGGSTATGRSSRTRLSSDEKRNLVKEYQASGSTNKKEFAEDKGIGYQSFLKWEKEFPS